MIVTGTRRAVFGLIAAPPILSKPRPWAPVQQSLPSDFSIEASPRRMLVPLPPASRSAAQASILNGAVVDMLGAKMPAIQPTIYCVLHWGSAGQPLDFTRKDDFAAYAVALSLRGIADVSIHIAPKA
jgi:hypothetical protein